MNWHIILTGLVLFSTMLCCQGLADERSFTAPGIGYIEVRSDIEGARVYFDTLYMGYVWDGKLTIPVDTTVSPIWRNVRMEYTGYVPYIGPYTETEPGKTVAYRIDLSKSAYGSPGLVQFISDPPGAEFLINDRSMGITPDSGVLIAYTVPRGLYTVNARRAGDQTITDQLYVDNNAATTYRVSMVPSPLGEMQVNSTPPGADIYLDNHAIGLTPLCLTDVMRGEHIILIRKDGYQDWIANISVIGGSVGSAEAVLVSAPPSDCLPPTELTGSKKQ